VEARFSAPVQTGPAVHPASYTMGTGSFPGEKRPERGVDHPPSSSAEVKERVELYLYSPSGTSWPVIRRTLPSLCPLERRLGVPRSRLGRFGEGEKLFPARNRNQIPQLFNLQPIPWAGPRHVDAPGETNNTAPPYGRCSLHFFRPTTGCRNSMRAIALTWENFRRHSFACGNLSILAPHFRLFQRRLLTLQIGVPGSCPAGPPLIPTLDIPSYEE
jgi:hypothetical protein